MTTQGSIRQALLDAAGETGYYSLDSEIDPLYISLTSGVPPTSSLLDLLQQINAANGTRHFARAADDRDDWYQYTTRNRQWKLGAAADASVDASVQHVTSADSWRVTADTVINQQEATVDLPIFPEAPIKVWEYAQLPPLPITIVSGTPWTLALTYADYVLSCPYPVIRYTGDAPTVEILHHGYSADLVVTSPGSTVLQFFQIWGREAVRQPSQTYTANDAASQAVPRGVRAAGEISGDFVGCLDSAKGIANHMVWRYAQPKKRPSVTVDDWLTALQWDLFDLLAVTSAQLKAAGLVFEVVGINETWERAAEPDVVHFETVYQLSEAPVLAVPFFLLDSSLLDGEDELAY